MTRSLQISDRVRLKITLRRQGYRAGDTGTVVAVMLTATRAGEVVYQVRIASDENELWPAFYADELELVE
jgi:hypothetical protein